MKTDQLEAIRKRAEKARGNWLTDINALRNASHIVNEDTPALLAEVERLNEQLREATSIALWSARRLLPAQKRYAYDSIDALTGEKSERL